MKTTKNKIQFFKPNVPVGTKNLNWNQAKARFPLVKPYGDADKDGVKNFKDCKPFDIKRQGGGHMLKGKGFKVKDEEEKEIEFGTYIPRGVVNALKGKEEEEED